MCSGLDRLSHPANHGLLAGTALTASRQGPADLLEGDRRLLRHIHRTEARTACRHPADGVRG